MYAIRKPFTAIVFTEDIGGYGIKSWMVIAQLLGYTISKFWGIKFLGELKRTNRFKLIVLILSLATLPLLFMHFTPCTLWPFWLLLNGIPLGLVWGVIFSYVEGRRFTELIGAILACTFIFSSGIVKSIAILLQQNQFSPTLIPFTIAVSFLIPSFLFGYILEKMPHPTAEEIDSKAKRIALSSSERKQIIQQYVYFIFSVIFLYGILTLIRDIRDNFGAEIMQGLNVFNAKNVTKLETWVTLSMILCIPFISGVKNNLLAIKSSIFAIFFGGILCILSAILYRNSTISGEIFILISGAGVYLGYILINISVMDRLIGFNGTPGNSGFLVYMADSAGYLCSLLISGFALFSKKGHLPWLEWYISLLIFGGIVILLFSILSYYFITHSNKKIHV